MIEDNIICNLRSKFSDVHPLVFARSVEKATSAGDLFDILTSIPKEPPFLWNHQNHRWISTDDMLQSDSFDVTWDD